VLEITARASLAVDRGIDVYLVDEIGKMECLSPGFVAAMRALLDAGRPVAATIGERGGGFIAEVKRRPDVTLWRLTRDNHDAVPTRILTWLRDHA
jgi:nucleoside-triphosphatase